MSWREFGHRCRRSWTMWFAAVLTALGALLDLLDVVFLLLDQPEMREVVTYYAGPYGCHVLKVIGVGVALCRVRSLRKGDYA